MKPKNVCKATASESLGFGLTYNDTGGKPLAGALQDGHESWRSRRLRPRYGV